MILFILILLSLCVGSFLNVVIYRLPRVLMQSWRAECEVLLGHASTKTAAINLCWPSSHCPQCQHHLRWWHNIPLLSFFLLKGRCAFCYQRIAWRYPIVEFASVAVAVFLYYHFHGLTLACIASMIFSGLLIALISIDIEHQLLPDQLVFILLWLGLLLNVRHVFVTPEQAIIGAVCGYLFLWIIAWVYQKITKREGMGQGDFKLLAALGAWTGWHALIGIILFASLGGLIISGVWLMIKRGNKHTPFAFGPYLAIAGWIMLLWGPVLQQMWLS